MSIFPDTEISKFPEARFFRDGERLRGLADAARRATPGAPAQPFRVWAASGSTGEDAFSAAMVLLERLGGRPLRLFATAPDAEAVSRARRGVFSAVSAAGTVSPRRLKRFFRREGAAVRVAPEARGSCVFIVHDLAERPPFVRLDAVYCPLPLDRWQAPARERALDLFHFALKPGGLLLLGGASSLSDPRFARVADGLYARAPTPTALAGQDLQRLLGRASAALRGEWRGSAAAPGEPARRLEKEFVALVSHELGTPLAAILGYTETLRRGVRNPRRARQFLATIDRNARRLMGTVESLVGFTESRLRDRRPEPAPLRPAARAAVQSLAARARAAGVRVTVDAPASARAFVDPADLPHILENLVGNAIKYNRRGGTVRVEARVAGGRALLSVRDTGAGISAEELPKVFDRFYRAAATRHVKGSGLGLSVVKGLVEANGGTVSVDSEPGRGSAFNVSLPAA